MMSRQLALIGTLLLSGCTYALHPSRTLAGQPFRAERLSEVTVGSSQEHVTEALGKPLEVIPGESGGSVWRFYERTQERGCRTELFGIFGWGDVPISSVEARVEIKDGIVKSVAVKRGK